MKDFSPLAFDQAIIGFPARIGVITRRDGVIRRFAESDEAIVVDGDTYDVVADLQVSAVKHTSDGEVPSCEMIGVLGASFDLAEIEIGLYDSAVVQIYVVDRRNLSRKGLLFTGAISDISVQHVQRQFSFSVKGKSASSRIVLTRKRSPMCQTDFGSALCQIDVEAYKAVTTVATIESAFSFTVTGALAHPDGYFSNGIGVTDAGKAFDIGNWTQSSQTVLAYLPSNRFLTVGQTVTLYKGCNKTLGAGGCADVSNQLNFQGEPHFLGTAAAAQQV